VAHTLRDQVVELSELRWFRFLIGRVGDDEGIPIVVSRIGYTGELGAEVWCHPDDGPAVWTRSGRRDRDTG
jgi:glycine cleavage system aminomethyltransferase T